MLNIQHLTIHYDGRPVVTDFTLSVERGELVCLQGDSGSGKTSLLRAILGFVPIASGTITVAGQPLTASKKDIVRSHTAYLPQELYLPADTVGEMVRTPFQLNGNRRVRFNEAQFLETARMLGLEENLLEREVSKVSGGQRQRLMLAASGLLNRPLLLLDEPTSALDAKHVHQVIAYLRSLTASGMTILAVSHDNTFAASCDKIVTLHPIS